MTLTRLTLLPVALLAACLCSSCATVKFYSDEGLRTETGLRVFSPKPFLLVEYDGTKTVSLKTSVIYLPDVSKPQYIRMKPGIGSANIKLELSNGILQSYGLTTDTKIPQTLGEVTDLLTKSTTAIGDVIRSKTEPEPARPAFELYEIIISGGQTRLVRVQ